MDRDKPLTLLGWACPLVMAWAVVSKLIDWDQFIDSLGTFDLVPDWGKALAVIAVPIGEAAPASLVLAKKPVAANIAVAATVSFFTAILGVHWINNTQPDCACLGEWARFDQIERIAPLMAIRNGTLIAVALIATAILSRNSRKNSNET